MKKLAFVFLMVILASCNSQKKYSDFDYSYSRSGGLSPIYENFYIKGKAAHYMFSGQGKDFKKDFTLTDADVKNLENAVRQNNFRSIQEDYKKQYDNIATIIKVKHGDNSGLKSDASLIMPKDRERWNNVVAVFRGIIDANVPPQK